MNRLTLLATVLVVSGATSAFVQTASAQSKVSFDQAYKLCTEEIEKMGSNADNATQRTTAGEACMRRHGYSLFSRRIQEK